MSEGRTNSMRRDSAPFRVLRTTPNLAVDTKRPGLMLGWSVVPMTFS